MTLYICGPKDTPENVTVINTTSRSDTWSRGLSPFYLGPVDLYGSYISKNVENAWQYSKVYKRHVGLDGNPKPEYFEWAKEGWLNHRAVRYPMGKGIKPEYSYWDGKQYSYTEARKQIYAPIYAWAVQRSAAFKQLKNLYSIVGEDEDIYLWDFDGYNHKKWDKSYSDVINDPSKKMGHAFVLGMLLENKIAW